MSPAALSVADAMIQYLLTVQEKTRNQHPNKPRPHPRKAAPRPAPEQNERSFTLTLPLNQPVTATTRSYRNGLQTFGRALREAGIDPDTTPVSELKEAWIDHLINFITQKTQSTEQLYLTAVSNFFHYAASEELAPVNLERVKYVIGRRGQKGGRRIPQFPRAEIEALIDYADGLAAISEEQAGEAFKTEAGRKHGGRRERLRNLRDRAFILFLADTGLRCSEACALTLGDVDFLEGRLNVIGKGDNQALVRVSERALNALNDYLACRKALLPGRGQTSGRANPGARGRVSVRNNPSVRMEKSQPLFIRHDIGAGDALSPTPWASGSAWQMVKTRALEAVGPDAAQQIHPHSFRHYFVTVVLLATDNLEKARQMARHKSIATTTRYAEINPELDQDYHSIFNQKRKPRE
jgi:site-specific recombinase XerD